MDFEMQIKENILLVLIKGEMDEHLSGLLRSNIDYALYKKEVKDIIFDLSDVTFLDSSGIGLFMGRYKRILKKGGRCAIVVNDKQILKILKISGILSIFDMFDSLEEGIREYENK